MKIAVDEIKDFSASMGGTNIIDPLKDIFSSKIDD
jgi:hypothetical protein